MQIIQGARIQCAVFGQFSKSLFASGDDKNNVQIWKLQREKCLGTMNYQSTQTAQVEVSAINFNQNEQFLFSGSNRGIINVWDVNTQKQISTLKGHVAAVNSLNFSPNDDSLLFSGAYDTLIKLWDLRLKNSTAQFKGHTNQVNCIQISPDGRILSSGSHDGHVKIWDIGTQKCLASFLQHDAPVNCLKYNPVDKALATGGSDRTVKYWDLDSLSMISSTRPDATAILCIAFEPNGKYTFSGAHESLKVWNLEKDGILLDNVESSWKGLQDLSVFDDSLYGLAAQGLQGFCLYSLNLQTINTTEMKPDRLIQRNSTRGKTPESRSSQANQQLAQQPQIQQFQVDYQRIQSVEENKLPPNPIRQKPNLAFQGRNILNNEQMFNNNNEQFRPGTGSSENNSNVGFSPSPIVQIQNQGQFTPNEQNVFVNQQIIPPTQYIPTFNPTQNNIVNQISNQNNGNLYINANPIFIKPNNNQILQELEEEIKVPDSQGMQIEESIISQDILTSGKDLNFSQFIVGDQKEKFKQIDLMSEINKEHAKVIQILKQRMNYMKPILHWWNSGNIKSSINAINQLNEPSIILDALAMCYQSQKFSQINLEFLPSMLEKSKVLIESKYMSHIKGGLEFVQKSLAQFKEEIISIKQFAGLSKGDLMREERIQKCDKAIDQFRQIVQMQKLQKIIDRNKEEISMLARNLQAELLIFLKRSTSNSIQLA